MRIFITALCTDFIRADNLISLGLAPEDETLPSAYIEITDVDKSECSKYVTENVLPMLDHEKFGLVREQAAAVVQAWFARLPYRARDSLTICVDHLSSWEALILLLDKKIPLSMNLEPFDIRRDVATRAVIAAAKGKHDSAWMIKCAQQKYTAAFNSFMVDLGVTRSHALFDVMACRYGYLSAVRWLTANT